MIYFRKIYQRIDEGGSVRYCFVAYYSSPCSFGVVTTGNHCDQITPQYRKRLVIDLWLCVLDFEWKTKMKELPKCHCNREMGRDENADFYVHLSWCPLQSAIDSQRSQKV